MNKLDISTDKIIAVGLIISCNIYAVSSVILGVPASGELLGTLFGGIIGALGRWAPQQKPQEEGATGKEMSPSGTVRLQQAQAETLKETVETATRALDMANAKLNDKMSQLEKKGGTAR